MPKLEGGLKFQDVVELEEEEEECLLDRRRSRDRDLRDVFGRLLLFFPDLDFEVERLLRSLDRDLFLSLDRDRCFRSFLVLDLDLCRLLSRGDLEERFLSFDLERALFRSLEFDRDLLRSLDLDRDLFRSLDLCLSLDLERDLLRSLDLDRDLLRSLDRDLLRSLDLDRSDFLRSLPEFVAFSDSTFWAALPASICLSS